MGKAQQRVDREYSRPSFSHKSLMQFETSISSPALFIQTTRTRRALLRVQNYTLALTSDLFFTTVGIGLKLLLGADCEVGVELSRDRRLHTMRCLIWRKAE
jgi:hypothetical protein